MRGAANTPEHDCKLTTPAAGCLKSACHEGVEVMRTNKARLATFLTAVIMIVALAAPEAMAKKKKNPCDVKLPTGTCVVR